MDEEYRSEITIRSCEATKAVAKKAQNNIQQGFIAQLVEHRTCITEDMGSILIEASDIFLGFLCN